jgi:peptidoglycan/xylan/chitin deacetylase (PgdA/CDA1 family)
MKILAKSALCALYKYSGVLPAHEALARWTGRSLMSILLLHRVTDAVAPDGITISEKQFRRLCRMLQRKFHVVPLAEIFRLLRSGTPPPPRTVAITFDDCYQDNLKAARLLADHGLPACFFVPTNYVGVERPFPWDENLAPLSNLSWDDLRAIAALGHEIGSHSASHPDFGKLGEEEARLELSESKRVLEEQLHRPVHWFAFPFGGPHNFRHEQLPLVTEVGYQGCVSAISGLIAPSRAAQVLPRVPVPAFSSLLHLEVYLTGCLNWLYAVKRRASMITS